MLLYPLGGPIGAIAISVRSPPIHVSTWRGGSSTWLIKFSRNISSAPFEDISLLNFTDQVVRLYLLVRITMFWSPTYIVHLWYWSPASPNYLWRSHRWRDFKEENSQWDSFNKQWEHYFFFIDLFNCPMNLPLPIYYLCLSVSESFRFLNIPE